MTASQETPSAGALAGIRVVEISSTPAGAWCGRLLAGFGADVLAVELHGAAAARAVEPFDDRGESIPWGYWSLGKRSRAIDERTAAGRAELRALAADADVVVTTATPGELEQLGLRYEDLGAERLVMVHVTPWGFAGPMAEEPGSDLLVAARSGWAFVNGLAHRAPLQPAPWQPSYCGGVAGCIAAIAALFQREETSRGQEVDVSLNDAMLAMYAPAFLIGQYSGAPVARKATADLLAGPVPVRDGYFALTLSRAHFWRDAMNLLELPDLADDPRWETGWYRAAHKDEYVSRVQEKMAEWEKMALFDELAARRVIAGPVLSMAELAENEHLRERGFWERDGEGREWPGAPVKMSATPWRRVDEPVPAAPAQQSPRPAAASRRPKGPLDGIRAVVLTQAWAGTFCTELLGLMGADVIQVESWQRLDSWRGSFDTPMARQLQGVASAVHPWNCNALYNSVNLNKRSVTLNLQDPRGQAIFRDMVKHADIVAENFSPRVLGNLGLGYDVLSALNPRVIVCSLSAYGHDGPWANIPGIGGTIEPTAGMSAFLGYEGAAPMNSGQMVPDPIAAYYGTAAILAALSHRSLTGKGQYIDLSMQEANLTFVGDAAVEYLCNGVQRPRRGNRSATMAPHGIYPSAREDEWIAIAISNDAEFAALANLIGLPAGESLATLDGRRQHQDELDEAIAAWSRGFTREEALERLGAAGAPAAPVYNGHDLVTDPLLRARGMLVDVTHPEVPVTPQIAGPFQFPGADAVPVRPAPLLGEHSFEVLHELLGLTESAYAELVAAGITGSARP